MYLLAGCPEAPDRANLHSIRGNICCCDLAPNVMVYIVRARNCKGHPPYWFHRRGGSIRNAQGRPLSPLCETQYDAIMTGRREEVMNHRGFMMLGVQREGGGGCGACKGVWCVWILRGGIHRMRCPRCQTCVAQLLVFAAVGFGCFGRRDRNWLKPAKPAFANTRVYVPMRVGSVTNMHGS